MKLIHRFFKGRRQPLPLPIFQGGLPQPNIAFAAIGDVHGCEEQLLLLWQKLRIEEPDLPIIHVGDYLDRGENSANVLKLLFKRQTGNNDILCLMGNHEKMFLDFLEDPENQGERWLHFGGLQTVASFGFSGFSGTLKARDYINIRDMVLADLGSDLVNWLKTLPAFWVSGNVAVVHAGADPRLPVDRQPSKNLIWGHSAFGHFPRQDGCWIVHGHTVVNMPEIKNGVISIDTGAYATDRLTAAIIRPTCHVEFIQAKG